MARPVTKFANVNSKQLRQLHEFYQSHRLASHRRRAHAMILSSQGYSPAEVAEILEADADTVRRWIDQFNAQGCAGLVDQPRSGGPPKLDAAEQEILRGLVDDLPKPTASSDSTIEAADRQGDRSYIVASILSPIGASLETLSQELEAPP